LVFFLGVLFARYIEPTGLDQLARLATRLTSMPTTFLCFLDEGIHLRSRRLHIETETAELLFDLSGHVFWPLVFREWFDKR
jgi:hypothetical protein